MTMFFQKIKTADVSVDELLAFKLSVLNLFHQHLEKIKHVDYTRSTAYYSKADMDFAKEEWSKVGQTIASFVGFRVSDMTDYQNFEFLKTVFWELVDYSQISIIVINNGDLVLPHIDVESRRYCWNFPIANYENSTTLAFTQIKPSKFSKVFLPDEIELIEEVRYEPNTIYRIDTQIPHSIRLSQPDMIEPRIVLSCTIT